MEIRLVDHPQEVLPFTSYTVEQAETSMNGVINGCSDRWGIIYRNHRSELSIALYNIISFSGISDDTSEDFQTLERNFASEVLNRFRLAVWEHLRNNTLGVLVQEITDGLDNSPLKTLLIESNGSITDDIREKVFQALREERAADIHLEIFTRECIGCYTIADLQELNRGRIKLALSERIISHADADEGEKAFFLEHIDEATQKTLDRIRFFIEANADITIERAMEIIIEKRVEVLRPYYYELYTKLMEKQGVEKLRFEDDFYTTDGNGLSPLMRFLALKNQGIIRFDSDGNSEICTEVTERQGEKEVIREMSHISTTCCMILKRRKPPKKGTKTKTVSHGFESFSPVSRAS